MEEAKKEAKKIDPNESMLGLVVYSPVVFLFIFLASFAVHLLVPARIGNPELLTPPGLFLMGIAPVIILWSQRALSVFRARERSGAAREFKLGPYQFTRNPTYVGLTLLTLGFALVLNSWPVLLGALLSFHIVSVAIVRREEALLEKKYGELYDDYRKKVRKWF